MLYVYPFGWERNAINRKSRGIYRWTDHLLSLIHILMQVVFINLPAADIPARNTRAQHLNYWRKWLRKCTLAAISFFNGYETTVPPGPFVIDDLSQMCIRDRVTSATARPPNAGKTVCCCATTPYLGWVLISSCNKNSCWYSLFRVCNKWEEACLLYTSRCV